MKEKVLIIIGLSAIVALAILFTTPADRKTTQESTGDQATSTAPLPPLPLPPPPIPIPTDPPRPGGGVGLGCQPTGCSGQVCSDKEVITTCEFREEYACFSKARCERQASGKCGWTETEAFKQCLTNLSPTY